MQLRLSLCAGVGLGITCDAALPCLFDSLNGSFVLSPLYSRDYTCTIHMPRLAFRSLWDPSSIMSRSRLARDCYSRGYRYAGRRS